MVPTHYFACARRKCGFTLIELMVATAIMAMLIMAVMGITSHVLSSWGSASGRLGANAEARIALQHLGDDLETLVVRPRSQVWLEVREPVSLALPGTYNGTAPRISLITATENRERSGTNNYGNICAVSYEMAYQYPLGGDKPYDVAGLYRKVINPKNTFDEILTELEVTAGPVGENGEATYVLPKLSALVEGTLSSDTATPAGVVAFQHFLNSNIVDLSVDFYAETNTVVNGIRTVEKVPVPFAYSDRIIRIINDIDGGKSLGEEMTDFGRIVYADIRMTVLTDEGAKALRSGSAPTAEIIKNHGTVFSRRVPILSRY